MMMMSVPISVGRVGPSQFAASQMRPGSVGGLVTSTGLVGVTNPAPVGTALLIADASVCVVPPAPPPAGASEPPPTTAATVVSGGALAGGGVGEVWASCAA